MIGLPNHLHLEAVELCAKHGKAVLCTKPLATHAAEAKQILEIAEGAGIFGGYLEDLVYSPKTLKAVAAVQAGRSATSRGRAPARRIPALTPHGSGTPSRPAAAR